MSGSSHASDDRIERPGPVARFAEELRRRKVLSTAGVYLFGSFVTMQVVDDVVPYVPFVTDPEAAGRVILSILIVGFPIAMVLAWVLELTPPQLKRERSRAEAEAEADRATRPIKELRPDTVGVLPFDNHSDDRADAYFSDGVTDDVIMSLTQIHGIRVLPRTTVSQYKGVQRSASQIAGELGAATLVSGSVRRDGTRIRVVVRAIDGRSEDHLWSDTFDRELQDVFQVQSEIATRVSEALQRELSAAAKARIEVRGTSDPEAYDLYLRARHLWNQRSEGAVASSIGYFQRALERDPNFALAQSGLADAFAVLGLYGMRAPEETMDRAREAAEAALAIDPLLGEAVATRSCIEAIHDWNWDAAQEGFRSALELAPSYATAHQWYAMNVLAPRGRFTEAYEQLDLALELDPASGAIAASRGILPFYARRYEAAIEQLEAVLRVHPRFGLAHYFLGQCYVLVGEVGRGLDCLTEATRLSDESSETLAALAHARAEQGEASEAEKILHRLEERSGRSYVSDALFAQILIGLGRLDEALERLEAARARHATDLIWLAVRPVYDPLRDSPRFQALVTDIGLADVGTEVEA